MSDTFLHLFVQGRVQGVWFRKTTRERALELGLRGWVRNLDDGRVELMAQGERVGELRAWVEAGGPVLARVDRVVQGHAPSQTLTPGFVIKR